MKSRFTLFEFPIFLHYIIHVEITTDISKSMEKYPGPKAAKDAGFDDAKAVSIHEKNEPFSFIFLPYNASTGDIAHEAWHGVKRMMEYCGVTLDNECVAYHLGYLTQGIFDFVRGKHDRREKG